MSLSAARFLPTSRGDWPPDMDSWLVEVTAPGGGGGGWRGPMVAAAAAAAAATAAAADTGAV